MYFQSFQFELKELRRRQEEDEQRRREEISRHSAGADKTDGEKSEAGSIRSGGKVSIFDNSRSIMCNGLLILCQLLSQSTNFSLFYSFSLLTNF